MPLANILALADVKLSLPEFVESVCKNRKDNAFWHSFHNTEKLKGEG